MWSNKMILEATILMFFCCVSCRAHTYEILRIRWGLAVSHGALGGNYVLVIGVWLMNTWLLCCCCDCGLFAHHAGVKGLHKNKLLLTLILTL